jgi:hypothetical protein
MNCKEVGNNRVVLVLLGKISIQCLIRKFSENNGFGELDISGKVV